MMLCCFRVCPSHRRPWCLETQRAEISIAACGVGHRSVRGLASQRAAFSGAVSGRGGGQRRVRNFLPFLMTIPHRDGVRESPPFAIFWPPKL